MGKSASGSARRFWRFPAINAPGWESITAPAARSGWNSFPGGRLDRFFFVPSGGCYRGLPCEYRWGKVSFPNRTAQVIKRANRKKDRGDHRTEAKRERSRVDRGGPHSTKDQDAGERDSQRFSR